MGSLWGLPAQLLESHFEQSSQICDRVQSCFTSTRKLLTICNCLSVRQLVFYQTVMMMHKTVKTGLPKHEAHEPKDFLQLPITNKTATNGSIRWNLQHQDFPHPEQLCLQGAQGLQHDPSQHQGLKDREYIQDQAQEVGDWKCEYFLIYLIIMYLIILMTI